tara:strand:- start:848 stop:1240 length:393 start_codon:yes stop_codon:yes gene_type:complete
MKIFLNTADWNNPKIELTKEQRKMDKDIKSLMKLDKMVAIKSLVHELKNLDLKWSLNSENQQVLDANWVGVTLPKAAWRLAKEVGAKKDGYYGWILWSGSTNDSGTNYYHEIRKICRDSKINVVIRECQL